MPRSTLALFLVAAAAAELAAQVPPTRPDTAPPARVKVAPRPVPAWPPMDMRAWPEIEMPEWPSIDVAAMVDDALMNLPDQLDVAHEAMERARLAMADIDLSMHFDVAALADAAEAIERADFRVHFPELDLELPDLELEMDRERPIPRAEPPAPRYPQDPADSLYRSAREMLNRGEYRRAAETFRQIEQQHPSSRYAADALYWEAFALYRIGTVADMRAALSALERQRERYPRAARESGAVSLATRIRGELAANGDSRAAARVRAAANPSGDACDKDEMAVRLEALNALSKMESEATLPALRQLLTRRDECSAGLRRRAVFLLGRQSDPRASDVLIQVVRNDPDVAVRREAVSWLARSPSEASVTVLQDVLVRPGDDRLASTALRALLSHENPRGKQIVRALIERNDANESLRAEAIGSFTADNATAEDAAFLRGVYPKLESRRLKERVITTVARLPGPENERWLSGIARGDGEPLSLRTMAISRLAASASLPEVVRLYDTVGERQLKEQLISRLAGRKEPEAVDKLIAIARGDPDPQLRRAAIARLAQRKDPRTTQLLLEIINQ